MKLKSAVVICMEDKEITKEERVKAHSPKLGEYMYASKLNPINGDRLVVSFEATYGWFNNKVVTLIGALDTIGNIYIFRGLDKGGYLMDYELDAINNYIGNRELFGDAIKAHKYATLRQSLNKLVS